jgi:hypothetical protein
VQNLASLAIKLEAGHNAYEDLDEEISRIDEELPDSLYNVPGRVRRRRR